MNTSVPTPSHSERPPHLRRALGLWRLVLYGLGVIIGAGIYVLIGTVVATAGMAAPLSFLAAGILAALVGLCYAELGARFPEAAGAAAYVKHGFGSDRLSQLTGLAVAAVAVVGAASIAHGCIGYAQRLVDLPGTSIAGGIVLCFTAVACLRVGESVGAAAVLAALEVAGLLVLIVLGTPALSALPARVDELIPADWSAWHGVAAGAFLAFFAFIGFENIANMAEETRDVGRTLPRAIMASLTISTALYVLLVLVAVLAVPLDDLKVSATPLLSLAARAGAGLSQVFTVVVLLSVANGVLVQILMLARQFYGMAWRGWLPAALMRLAPTSQVPLVATLTAGALVLFFTIAFDFVALVSLTSTLTLLVFALVAAALWRLHRRDRARRIARWIPPAAMLISLALVLAQFLV